MKWKAFKPKPRKSGEASEAPYNFLPTASADRVPHDTELYYDARYSLLQAARGNVDILEILWSETPLEKVYEYMILQRNYAEHNSLF